MEKLSHELQGISLLHMDLCSGMSASQAGNADHKGESAAGLPVKGK